MTPGGVSSEPTTTASYIEAIARALHQAGVEPQGVLGAAYADRARSNDPMLRITDSDINAIYERALAATGDACFGLRVARQIVPGMLHALGYALLASETLEDFCHRLVRYWGLVAQSGVYSTAETGGELVLSARVRSPDLCFETQDTWAALVVRLMRMASDPELSPLRVLLPRPMPAGGDGPYLEAFGCPVLFDQTSIGLHFDLSAMREPLPGASRELAQHNDQIVLRYLDKLDRDDIVNRVKARIVAALSGGSTSRSAVAASLNLSESTLQARLAKAGQTFQQILDGTRNELALAYLDQSRLSITEIAFMLGFSDLSNFIRAFRRWTGVSPTDYRGGAPDQRC